jgi:large subunit ribosomal protein L4
MKVTVYNQQGKKVEEMELAPAVFGVKAKPELIHQVVTAQMANRRQVIAHTKGRSEVRGGGRKPWRQKGTGRARHGSIRSPIWKGGGVTFGPTKERRFKQKINKKVKRLVLLMCLSDKLTDKKLVLLDKLELAKISTKKLKQILDKLPVKTSKTLMALAKIDKKIIKSAANIPYLTSTGADSLNVLKLLKHKYLLTTVEGIKKIEKIFKI